MYLYWYIILNIGDYPKAQTYNLLTELELNFLAKYLKRKFKDSRSIPELVKIIREEIPAWECVKST